LHSVREGDQSVLSFAFEAHGYGAVLATAEEPGAQIQQLMVKMKAMTATTLESYSHEWKPLLQSLVEVKPASLVKAGPVSAAPDGMVRIPGGAFLFKVEGIEIEGSNGPDVDVQYRWEDTPRRYHEHVVELKPFFMDKYPVTNEEFKRFLDATHYAPKDALNFLKDWSGGSYPAGWGKKPVTWVSLEDARAYAAWAGKRLPREWEWQYAAQGAELRVYPWGDSWKDDAVPVPDKSRKMRGPDDVDAHPGGASPFGVMDMVGNVWQWTDEYSDKHTRAAILRGGEYYRPQGSIWYFPQAYRNDQHGKLLLMAPSYDRSGGVGFRCVQDAE